MKRRWIALLLAAALLLAGCGEEVRVPADWDETWAMAGDRLAAEPPEGFEQGDVNDLLSYSGIWVFTWHQGESRPFVNAEEEEALVYDAQLYLLVMTCDNEAQARVNVEDWLAREAQQYEVGARRSFTAAGQEFQLLPLLQSGADNPYSHGAAAFAARGDLAFSLELLCGDGFAGDPEAVLEQFAAGLHYGE